MAHYRFVRNRAFIRSIPGVGRDIWRDHQAATCEPIPFYLSKADEIANRKAANRLRRDALKINNASAFGRIQEIVSLGQQRLAEKAKSRKAVDVTRPVKKAKSQRGG